LRPWVGTINLLHEKAVWVVCIDSLIDEKQINFQEVTYPKRSREIIGFASGLGSHGQLNYTISTEKASLVQIEQGIENQLEKLFRPWNRDDVEKTAHLLVSESRKLSGLSLVRATGPTNYIHDLISYSLAKLCETTQPDLGMRLCNETISLDSYKHWFLDAEKRKRPDLMRLEAFLNDKGTISLRVQLIELKLAAYSQTEKEDARSQLENGLRHLTTVFRPKCNQGSVRFNQRYWRAQLQRLIATRGLVDTALLPQVTAALEKLIDGDFDIWWQAFGLAFWKDQEFDGFQRESSWTINLENK